MEVLNGASGTVSIRRKSSLPSAWPSHSGTWWAAVPGVPHCGQSEGMVPTCVSNVSFACEIWESCVQMTFTWRLGPDRANH